ncbi:MAG TPA: FadR/GntR family transcriptional regulator [Chthoniobacterales bacterium]|nr:FadR/GntR family transcriptional regulator [Chthoniobacterales bacterium]
MKKNRASDRTAAPPLSDGAVRVSHKIVRQLQDIIAQGELKTGAFLPSERELASRYWVSRSSVREALSILETLGLVAIEPGCRARVLGTSTEPDKRLTRWQYASKFNEHDVYELRLALESRAARLAAEKMNPQTIADLTASLAAMKDNMRLGDLLAAANDDFKFHDIIVHLSGNRLFAEIHHLNREAILESQKLPLARHKRLWEPVQEHEPILQALEQRDPDGASYLMQLHIIRAADRVGITLKS